MNVIEAVKQIVLNFPGMSDFTGDVMVDSTEGDESYGISPNAPTLYSTNIKGKQTWIQSFTLYAVNKAINDYDRLINSSFMVNFMHYLSKAQCTDTVTIDNKAVVITEFSPSSGITYEISEDGQKITYQLQFYATYTIQGE